MSGRPEGVALVTTDRLERSVRCLGCHKEYGSLQDYRAHLEGADHADAGEVFVG